MATPLRYAALLILRRLSDLHVARQLHTLYLWRTVCTRVLLTVRSCSALCTLTKLAGIQSRVFDHIPVIPVLVIHSYVLKVKCRVPAGPDIFGTLTSACRAAGTRQRAA